MFTIAIDGYSGSGKGTLADGLAEKFNLKHLDTGSILRSTGLYFFEQNIFNPTAEDINNHIKNIQIKIEFEENVQKTYLNGKDVSREIRKEEIGQMASKVAIYEKAMMKVFEVSRDFANNYNCVVDGRNITSAVLPDADVKIFLDASIDCRTNRRLKENQEKNLGGDYANIYSSMKERDYRDTHRDFAPMVITADTTIVDNTNLNAQETIDFVSKIVEKKLNNIKKI